MGALKAAAWKTTNLSKVSEVSQGPDETPSVFLELLLEAYHIYIPIDPEASENNHALNIIFVSQLAPDIRKKASKARGIQRKGLSELVEIAQKVFNK